MKRVPAVVDVEVVDFAIEHEAAAGYPLCYAPGHRSEERSVVLRGRVFRFEKFTPKISHGIFGHMHGVLNKIYLFKKIARMGYKSRDESNEHT